MTYWTGLSTAYLKDGDLLSDSANILRVEFWSNHFGFAYYFAD